MPHHALDARDTDAAVRARLTALREELELPGEFPDDVLAEAQRSAQEVLSTLESDESMASRVDLREMPFVTIDPRGSRDLDQAVFIEAHGPDGLRVHYAIADLPAFVDFDGALDAEARRRGQTVYLPDGRVPLHPPVISEDAGSLLGGQDRPAFVWQMDLDAEGALGEVQLRRALVRSRAQLTYDQVQRFLDTGETPALRPAPGVADAETSAAESADEADDDASHPGSAPDVVVTWGPEIEQSLSLLPEVGELRRAQEALRGGASLNLPDQEIHVGASGYELHTRIPLPIEDDNAHVSLLTGMAAARIMLEGGVGVLRTMPAPDQDALDAFRARAEALGHAWPAELDYGGFLRTLDPALAHDLAILHAATSLFRGADYTVFDDRAEDQSLRGIPEDPEQSALAAPYAHATAPLRRLVDRFVLMVCHALVTGQDVPGPVRAVLPELPELMRASGQRASRADRGAVDLVEAAVLSRHVGHVLPGTVVRTRGESAEVQLQEPPALVRVEAELELGAAVRVRIEEADVATATVGISLAETAEG
ncbi:MAG: RNB domain-containing ribonuclease [Micrococcus sp.]|nr:RNB domain-containing ribonuclease [Micrococcus sp.]